MGTTDLRPLGERGVCRRCRLPAAAGGRGRWGAAAGPGVGGGGAAGGRRALGGSRRLGGRRRPARPDPAPLPSAARFALGSFAGFCAGSFSLGRRVGSWGRKLLATWQFVALLVLNG